MRDDDKNNGDDVLLRVHVEAFEKMLHNFERNLARRIGVKFVDGEPDWRNHGDGARIGHAIVAIAVKAAWIAGGAAIASFVGFVAWAIARAVINGNA